MKLDAQGQEVPNHAIKFRLILMDKHKSCKVITPKNYRTLFSFYKDILVFFSRGLEGLEMEIKLAETNFCHM